MTQRIEQKRFLLPLKNQWSLTKPTILANTSLVEKWWGGWAKYTRRSETRRNYKPFYLESTSSFVVSLRARMTCVTSARTHRSTTIALHGAKIETRADAATRFLQRFSNRRCNLPSDQIRPLGGEKEGGRRCASAKITRDAAFHRTSCQFVGLKWTYPRAADTQVSMWEIDIA